MQNFQEDPVFKEFKIWVEHDIAGETLIETNFGKTQVDQYYALLIIQTQENKYEVRLYMDEDHREHPQKSRHPNYFSRKMLDAIGTDFPSERYIESTIFDELEESKNYIEDRKEKLKSSRKEFFEAEKRVCRERFMPDDCIENPGKYLKPGDHIRTWLVDNPTLGQLAHHDGIYIGEFDGIHYVIHISNHCLCSSKAYKTKNEAHVRIGDFHENFLSSNAKEVIILVYSKRFRRREEIVCHSMLLASRNFWMEEYHLFEQNCQHFSTYCATGKMTMVDKRIILRATNFMMTMSNMVESVFGRLGNPLYRYVENLKEKINGIFGTRDGQDSKEIVNATWENIKEIFEILLSAEENKETRIVQLLSTPIAI